MKLLNKILLIQLMLIVFFSTTICIAANLPKNNTGKIATTLEKGNLAFQEMKFAMAAEYYEAYIKTISNPPAILLNNLAECYWQMRQLDQAFRIYTIIYPAKVDGINPITQKRIAELYARKGEYDKAAIWLQQLSGYEQKADFYASKIKLNTLKSDSSSWQPFLLNINTNYREFAPLLHQNTLYFSSNKIPVGTVKSYGWDGENYTRLWQIPVSQISKIYDVEKSNTTSKSVVKKSVRLAEIYENGDNKSVKNQAQAMIHEPYITAGSVLYGTLVTGLKRENFNAGTIAIDGTNDIYFSANYPKPGKNGINRIRILEGHIQGNNVFDIKPIPFGNANEYSVLHPAINNTGTILVFSSDKPNGSGGYDLYYSQRTNSENQWSSPVAFGKKINTVGNEVFPSISVKGILYFSSDQMPGLGGLDIYRIPLLDAMNDNSQPEHLSYPINSGADDFGMTTDSTEYKGYFASDRLNSNDDLYGFEYIIRKNGQKYLEGVVVNKQTLLRLEGITVFVLDKQNDSVMVVKTDEKGQFNVPLRSSGDYVVKAFAKDFMDDCLTVSSTVFPSLTDSVQPLSRYLMLDQLNTGLIIRLNNIHYDFDKWFIRSDARPILDSLVTLLKKYPINVELSSHTDCRGSFAYNDRLSQRRANAAVAYLIKQGIDHKRITAKGYGEHKLINQCADGVRCSEIAHQANRRTEVKVTGFTTESPYPEFDPLKFYNGQKITFSELPEGFFDSCK